MTNLVKAVVPIIIYMCLTVCLVVGSRSMRNLQYNRRRGISEKALSAFGKHVVDREEGDSAAVYESSSEIFHVKRRRTAMLNARQMNDYNVDVNIDMKKYNRRKRKESSNNRENTSVS